MSRYSTTLSILITLTLLCSDSVLSQGRWKLNLDNEIDLTSRYYTKSNDTNLENYQAEMRTFHNLKVKFKSIISFNLSARSVLNINDIDRNRAWMNEAYGTVRLNNLNLKAGKQTIKWGSMTGISALDMLNRYDYYDFLNTDEEYLGIWAGKLSYNTGPLNWTLLLAENKNRSKLHFDGNRWIRMPKTTILPQDPNSVYNLELENINNINNFNSPQISLEVDFDIKNVSTRLFAYRGSNDIPQLSIEINSLEEQRATYDLNLTYHNINIYGIGLSTYLRDWNIWYELSHIQNQQMLSTADLAKDVYWNFTMGVDRMFTFENPEKSIKWIFQYCRILGANDDSYGPTDLDHLFENSLLTELQYTHNYKWKMDLRSVFDIGNKGVYLNPRIKLLVSNQIHLQLSSDILMGSTESFWGHYNDNTRLSFHLQYALQ